MSQPIPIRSGRFQHGDFQLAYEIWGETGVPCVLVHGLLLDSLINREIARKFAAEGFQVVLLDLLGHGASDKPTDPREHRVDFYAEQLLGCMDHLGFERAVIGGISLGAITALQAAVIAPKRVTALFLEMPVMEWSTTFAAILLVPLIAMVDFAKPVQRAIARFLRGLPRPQSEWLASGLNAASAEPEVIRAVLHGILVGPVVPSARRRRTLTMPTLVIGHGGDKLHELADAESLAQELPNATLLMARSIFELRWKPARLMPEILAFMAKVRDQAGQPEGALPVKQPALGSADLAERFEALVERVRTAPKDGPFKPSNELKLKLYGLYRQARDGDVSGKRPGMMDLVARLKYDAWAALKGQSREQAMQKYLDEVGTIEQKLAS